MPVLGICALYICEDVGGGKFDWVRARNSLHCLTFGSGRAVVLDVMISRRIVNFGGTIFGIGSHITTYRANIEIIELTHRPTLKPRISDLATPAVQAVAGWEGEGARPQTGFSTLTATSIRGKLGLLKGTKIFVTGIIIIHAGCYDYKNYLGYSSVYNTDYKYCEARVSEWKEEKER